MGIKIVLQVLIGLFVLGSFGFESVFAETLIAASGEGTPAHFSKVNIGTGADSQFLGNSGLEFSGIDVSPDGRLFAASSGQGDGGLYELSVTIENGNSVATPILVDFPELTCSDISFSPTGTLYCMVTNFNSDLERGGLYSIDVDSGVLTFIGNPGLGRTSGNGLAINSAGIIYFGNDDGLYILNPVTGSATEVAPWNLVDTVFSRCKSNAMDFDSSDTLHASFQCGFDPYLGTIDTLTAKVSIIGPLSSTNPVYSAFPFRLGDMKTDAITFAPFDFDFLVGPTHGTVDVVGIVNVVPNPPNGVLVSTLAPVNIGLCENSSLAIGIGDTFTAECGSVTIQVLDGTVVADFEADDGSIAHSTLKAGDNVTFIETLFSITNHGLFDVQVTVDEGVKTIPKGKTVFLGETPLPTVPNDHYLGYKAKQPKDADKFEKFTVMLDDQFESASYTVEKIDRLYNPVQKSHDGIIYQITDYESHYVGYKIKTPKGDTKFEKVTNVLVTNQFGDITVDVKKAKLLLVPSAKDHFTTPDPLDPVRVDHYKCYDAKESKDTPKFEKLVVSLYDPNFEITQDFEVKKSKMLCTPVQKSHDGTTTPIKDQENHLMCYDVKKMKDTPKFEKRNVFTNNQFGTEELNIEKQKDLCVPSYITLPEPPL